MELEERIIAEVDGNHQKTNGHCGLDPVRLKNSLGVEYEELRTALNSLVAKGKIIARWGINKKLIFKNGKSQETGKEQKGKN